MEQFVLYVATKMGKWDKIGGGGFVPHFLHPLPLPKTATGYSGGVDQ